ncbi:MAG: DUF3027 domain-containing protein [Frankiaceae bacterium]|nr:DUF3027 domain-containing protein [Frankiaceae bacterium]
MSTTATPTSEAAAEPVADDVCVAAVDVARAAAVEVAGPAVGDHLGVEVDDARVVTHSFATTEKAYRGWRWAVTVARADGTDEVTVDEIVLLPGSGALVSPEWVPWSERVQPGDLSPGDLLPPKPDDLRLVPAYADPDAFDDWSDLHWELGLGRVRVLSLDGRADAAERWYDGDRGPASPIAKAAPARCFDCGFLVPLAGSMRQLFGVCANVYAPDDAKVVSLDHGCGAHSEVVADAASATWTGMAVEHDELELIANAPFEGHSPGTVDDADPAEPLGHS